MGIWDDMLKMGFPPHQVYQGETVSRLFRRDNDEILSWFLLFEASHRDRGNLRLPLKEEQLKLAISQWEPVLEGAFQERGCGGDLPELLIQRGVPLFKENTALYKGESAPYVISQDSIYSRRQFGGEHRLIELLSQRLQFSPSGLPDLSSRELDSLLELWKGQAPVPPSEELARAFSRLCSKPLSLISGGPGTGKTTLLLGLIGMLRLWAQGEGWTMPRIALAAPTGRAAKRMTQAFAPLGMENLEARTLHRLLGLNRRGKGGNSALSCDLLVVDEASMMDVQMFIHLLERLPDRASLLLIGDQDQLPSVESGAVLGDMLKDVDDPGHRLFDSVTLLSRIYRSTQSINQLARRIGQGDHTLLPGKGGFPQQEDLQIVELPSQPEDLAKELLGFFNLPGDRNFLFSPHELDVHVDKVQPWFDLYDQVVILSPLRKGPWGIDYLNDELLGLLYSPQGDIFHGQPIMIGRNDYELNLFNGDRGIIFRFKGQPYGVFPRDEGGYRGVALSYLNQWETCYAQTIHKSQGSEYEKVHVLLPPGAETMMYRELLYTAVTRARKKINLFVDSQSMQACLGRKVERFSGLADFFKT